MTDARGYFGIGAEGISKARNVGSLFRSANAFGASFAFTVNAHHTARNLNSADTSRSYRAMPTYEWESLETMILPKGCQLVGVELIDGAVDLPRFRHPPSAAYVLGRERGSLSPDLLAKCHYVIKIPTEFCLNVAIAGTIVMYDRLLSVGRYGDRPVVPGGFKRLPDTISWENVKNIKSE